MKRTFIALGTLAALLSTTALSVAKDQVYHVRVIAQWTTTETLSSTGTPTYKGKATIVSSYGQNFVMTYTAGYLSLSKPEGPASSSVNGSITGEMEQPGLSSSGSFGSTFQPPDAASAAVGSGTAAVTNLDEWPPNGKGLGFRFTTDAILKGTCHTSNPNAPTACLAQFPGGYGQGNGGLGDNSGSDAQEAPHTYSIQQQFDVTSDPSSETSALATATVLGGINNGYHFTYSGAGTQTLGPFVNQWTVSTDVRITILTKASNKP